MKRGVLRILIIIALLISNISCDQISKRIVRSSIDADETIELIRNHFTLMKTENTGAFLGTGDSLADPFKFILLSLIPVLALFAGLYFLFTRHHLSKMTQIGLCFMIGGGTGNLYDRIVHGSVTDFLHLDLVVFQTGIFNLADVSIMIGMFILVLNANELNSFSIDGSENKNDDQLLKADRH